MRFAHMCGVKNFKTLLRAIRGINAQMRMAGFVLKTG